MAHLISAQHTLYIATVFLSCMGQVLSYVNNWDGKAHFECAGGGYLSLIDSYHDNGKEDRRWKFDCRGTGAVRDCQWSPYVNTYDQPLSFMCPDSKVVTGMSSVHDNKKEDRIFKFKCCGFHDQIPINCHQTNYVNDWDGRLLWQLPHGHVMTGAFSFHNNGKEDRRWKITECDLRDKCH